MRVMQIVAATALTTTLILMPTPSWACSIDAPRPLEDVLEAGEIYSDDLVGVHEQRHLIRFPKILNLFPDRSASVVVRYWGEEPNLRVASHGADGIPLLALDSCGKSSKPAGYVSAHANTANSLDRARDDYPNLAVTSGEYGGPLSDAEAAMLDDYFGASTAVSVGLDDYLLAYAFVLWRPVLTIGLLAAVGYGIRSRLRRERTSSSGAPAEPPDAN